MPDYDDLVLRLPPLAENATIASISSYITMCIFTWSTTSRHRDLLEKRIQQALQLIPDSQTRQDIVGFIVQRLNIESSLLAAISQISEATALSITQLVILPTLEDILSLYGLAENQLQALEGMSTSEYRLYLAGEQIAVEVIRTSLLRTRGFEYFDQWEDYLLKLDEHQVIDLIDCKLIDYNNIVVLYSIPMGYQRISKLIQAEDFSNYSKLGESLRVIGSLNDKARIAKQTADGVIGATCDFEVFTVFPDLVTWSEIDLRLIGIGASLVNARRYVSAQQTSIILKTDKTEIRSRAYPRFLGLMFFELITTESPIIVEEELRERTARPYLSESPLITNLGYPAHIRAFLKRATHSIDTFRYSKFETISEDIQYIDEFVEFITHSTKDEEIEFVDYLGLRLKAHNRNPKLLRMTSFERAQSLLTEISDDFSTFVGDDKTWMYRIRQNSSGETLKLPANLSQWLHYTSLHLLDVYNLWCSLLGKWKSTILSSGRTNGLEIISFAILAEVARLETLAYMQVLGRKLKAEYRQTDIPKIFVLDFDVAQAEEYAIGLVDTPLVRTRFDFSVNLIDQTKHIFNQLFTVDDYRRFSVADVALRGQSASIIDVAFFALVAGQCLVVFNQGKIIWSNAPTSNIKRQKAQLHLRTAEDIKHFALKLIKVFPGYETDPPPNAACFVSPSSNWNEISSEILNILDSLYQSIGAERERVYISRYHQSYPSLSGDIQYRERSAETNNSAPFTERDLVSVPFALDVPGRLRAKVDTFGPVHSLATVVPFIKLFPLVADTPKERVFIVYHYVDIAIFTKIVNRCRQEKYEVVGFRDTPVNIDWWSSILQEIQEADLIIAVCSTQAVDDEAFTSICKFATDLQKSLHTLVIDESVEQHGSFGAFRSDSHSITLYKTNDDTALNGFFQKIIDADVWTYRPRGESKIALPTQPTYLPLTIVDTWLETNEDLPSKCQELILDSLKWNFRHDRVSRTIVQQLGQRLWEHKNIVNRIKEEVGLLIRQQKGPLIWWRYLDTGHKVSLIIAIITVIGGIIAAIISSINININTNTTQPTAIYFSTLVPTVTTDVILPQIDLEDTIQITTPELTPEETEAP